MTDIVQRLRERITLPADDCGNAVSQVMNRDGEEAAAEILRLRQERNALRSALRPFAEHTKQLLEDTSEWPDSNKVGADIDIGILRRVHAAIGPLD